ncbi:membrane protein [Mycobacterium paraintracellulare]|nr:membrane protein [Mycobacterium paraintracellulare]
MARHRLMPHVKEHPSARRPTRLTRTPVLGVTMIAPLVFAAAVGAAAPQAAVPGQAFPGAVSTPVTSIVAAGDGPAVVAAERPRINLHIAAAPTSAPAPTVAVNSTDAPGIPTIALSAYRNAEQKMAVPDPACGISWNLLAGIGRIESMHANGGATDSRGTAIRPIYGPALDGSRPGNEVIAQSSADGHISYARAMGPMQFLPGTWARYAADGDGDGIADPQNLYDSTLAAARYLCSGGLNLRDPSQVMVAILRYNNSASYARAVLGWSAAYASGVLPVDLPPLTGPPPPIGDVHLENPEGIGPGLPLNIHGLPSTDPLAQMPLIDSGPSAIPSQEPTSAAAGAGCIVICIGR